MASHQAISQTEYESYKEKFKDSIWNFKEEAIKYCNLDCIALYQILSKFNLLIFNKFKLNITNSPTLSSLAFSIFRSHYLKLFSIYQISGKIEKDIRTSYTGGSVDMFIPTLSNKMIYDDYNNLIQIENKKIYA